MRPRVWRRPRGSFLEARTRVRVRFQEVDSLRIVWHGHYVTYFEEARIAVGKQFGINYMDFVEAGLLTPVVHVSCDYVRPAGFMDDLEVTGRIYRQDSAKLHYYFEVHRSAGGVLLATGQTIHAFTRLDGSLCLTLPDFMRQWYQRWEAAMLCD